MFDKTGTLTVGRPVVTNVIMSNNSSMEISQGVDGNQDEIFRLVVKAQNLNNTSFNRRRGHSLVI